MSISHLVSFILADHFPWLVWNINIRLRSCWDTFVMFVNSVCVCVSVPEWEQDWACQVMEDSKSVIHIFNDLFLSWRDHERSNIKRVVFMQQCEDQTLSSSVSSLLSAFAPFVVSFSPSFLHSSPLAAPLPLCLPDSQCLSYKYASLSSRPPPECSRKPLTKRENKKI